jgi:hypothetical protein
LPTGMHRYRLLMRADDRFFTDAATNSNLQPPLRISVAPNASALRK